MTLTDDEYRIIVKALKAYGSAVNNWSTEILGAANSGTAPYEKAPTISSEAAIAAKDLLIAKYSKVKALRETIEGKLNETKETSSYGGTQ